MRLAHHELVSSRESGVQFAADAMAPGRIEFLADTDAQGHPGGGVALLEAFGLSGVRLLGHAGNYYPQRHLLWFFGYSPDQVPYAKVILALGAVSTEQVLSVPGFIEAYAETFPAEREMILDLADEVFGQVSQ